jgi:hypothetical protein
MNWGNGYVTVIETEFLTMNIGEYLCRLKLTFITICNLGKLFIRI